MCEFCLRFHWSLFLGVQLTIFQHWLRLWLGADQATSHYLNQWWLDLQRIYASLGLNELMVLCQGNHWSQVDSSHKVPICGTLMFYLLLALTRCSVSCDLRCQNTHVKWLMEFTTSWERLLWLTQRNQHADPTPIILISLFPFLWPRASRLGQQAITFHWYTLHYSHVTWVPWHLKLPSIQLFVQQVVHPNNKANVEVLHQWPLVRGGRWWQVDSSCYDLHHLN